jgi:membrane-associated phospholipid phosphatase
MPDMPASTVAGRPLDPGLRRALAVTAAVALVVFLVAVWAVRADTFFGLDRSAHSAIRDGRTLVLDAPMRMVSDLATGYVLLPLTVLGSVILWRRGQHAVARALPVIGVATAVVLAITKWLVGKPRPSLRGYGFPSGHVFGATVFVLMVVYLLWRYGAPLRWRLVAGVAGLAFIVAVAYSRLHVGAHWPSDVLGGAVFGIAFALVTMLALDARLR